MNKNMVWYLRILVNLASIACLAARCATERVAVYVRFSTDTPNGDVLPTQTPLALVQRLANVYLADACVRFSFQIPQSQLPVPSNRRKY